MTIFFVNEKKRQGKIVKIYFTPKLMIIGTDVKVNVPSSNTLSNHLLLTATKNGMQFANYVHFSVSNFLYVVSESRDTDCFRLFTSGQMRKKIFNKHSHQLFTLKIFIQHDHFMHNFTFLHNE